MKKGKIKLLFICLGNICRSPAAHAVMQKLVDDNDLQDAIEVDSAGIGNWHVGQLPDSRMRERGSLRGYRVDHHARQFDAAHDFAYFDYIVVMDEDNYRNITRQAHGSDDASKVVRMADYFSQYPNATSVPDPYYGGISDFDRALDLIEDGCSGLLKQLI